MRRPLRLPLRLSAHHSAKVKTLSSSSECWSDCLGFAMTWLPFRGLPALASFASVRAVEFTLLATRPRASGTTCPNGQDLLRYLYRLPRRPVGEHHTGGLALWRCCHHLAVRLHSAIRFAVFTPGRARHQRAACGAIWKTLRAPPSTSVRMWSSHIASAARTSRS